MCIRDSSVIEVLQALEDVVADERAVLLSCRLGEARAQTIDDQPPLCLAGQADAPEGLQRVAGGDEALVFGDGQQGREVSQHTAVGVAEGQVAQHLRGD